MTDDDRDSSAESTDAAAPMEEAPQPNPLDPGHHLLESQHHGARVDPSAASPNALATSRPDPAQQQDPLDPGHHLPVAHTHGARVDPSAASPNDRSTPILLAAPREFLAAWDQADQDVVLIACTLHDVEHVRIATQQRVGALERTPFADELAGPIAFGTRMADSLGAVEHTVVLDLQRALRRHPLGPWVKQTVGVGEKQGARLIASIGNPYWHPVHDRPRTVSELWAYCGYHVLHPGHGSSGAHTTAAGVEPSDPAHRLPEAHQPGGGVAPPRPRGQRANWNWQAKMRAFLVAEACVRYDGSAYEITKGPRKGTTVCPPRSPYRDVYDAGREKYADAVHAQPCPRCGPAGKPALTGSPLSLGHQHARAMRLVAKEILKDLWREARRLHGVEDDADLP